MRILCLAPLLAAAILCLGPHYSDAGRPSEPPPPAAEQLVRGLTEFGLALYGEMARKDGNIVMSPLSVLIATAMLDAGAAGQTRAEIAAAARFGLPEEQLHVELQSLIGELSARVNKWAELSFANGVWIDQRCAPSDDYRQLLARCYGATPETLRFGEHPEEACAQINGFVLEHTRGKIPSVVDPDMFSGWTPLCPGGRRVLPRCVGAPVPEGEHQGRALLSGHRRSRPCQHDASEHESALLSRRLGAGLGDAVSGKRAFHACRPACVTSETGGSRG